MIIALATVAILAFLFYASYSIKSQVYVRALCRVKTDEKVVYLTFDDAPDAVQTPKVLDVLKRNNIKAAFFCIGSRVAGCEPIVKRIADDGHLIGNHSYSHKNTFPLLSRRKMVEDIERCQSELKRATGSDTQFFRPPFGVTNPRVAYAVKKLNLNVIGWSIRTYDTNQPPVEKVLRRIRRQLKSGSIILLHDGICGSETLLQAVIDTIRSEGYSFGELKL
ncbi:MAG: polysaccharide deacetylase family protein [Salinivirgaceae bacterium]|nr:polysaccharide deacetylase family protein [Salinivirgaceae bacterium]